MNVKYVLLCCDYLELSFCCRLYLAYVMILGQFACLLMKVNTMIS